MQRNHLFQSSSLQCAAPATKNEFRHFPQDMQNCNMTTTQTCHFHETLRLCSEMHHLSCMTYHFYANHNGIAAQTDTRHVHEKSLFRALPNGRAIGAGFEHLRTVADGCERLRTVANTKTTTGEHSSTLRLPKLNENPSLRIRENMEKIWKNRSIQTKKNIKACEVRLTPKTKVISANLPAPSGWVTSGWHASGARIGKGRLGGACFGEGFWGEGLK